MSQSARGAGSVVAVVVLSVAGSAGAQVAPPPGAAQPGAQVAPPPGSAQPGAQVAPLPGSAQPGARPAWAPPPTSEQRGAPPPPPGYGYGYGYAPPPYWQSPPPEPTRTWYGWQTLLVDGASISLLLVGSGSSSGEIAGAGGLGYFFAAPIVHWAHGNVGAGFASLGIRGGTAAVALLGAVSCITWGGQSNGSGCVVMVAGVLGMVAAIPIDAAVLAYDEPKDRAASIGPLHHLALAPVFGPGSGARSFEMRPESVQLDARSSQLGGWRGGLVFSGRF